MSRRRRVVIVCDDCKEVLDMGFRLIPKAVEDARERGWWCGRNRDRCDRCRAANLAGKLDDPGQLRVAPEG